MNNFLRILSLKEIREFRNSVRLAIRKVQYAPDKKGPQPTADMQKLFLMSDKPLCLEATLDKDVSTG